jgi:hypothetical protein
MANPNKTYIEDFKMSSFNASSIVTLKPMVVIFLTGTPPYTQSSVDNIITALSFAFDIVEMLFTVIGTVYACLQFRISRRIETRSLLP